MIRYATTQDAGDEPILSLEDCGKPMDGLKAFDLSTIDQTKLQAAMTKAASGVGASSPKDVESFWLLSRDGTNVVVQALKGTKQAGVAIA